MYLSLKNIFSDFQSSVSNFNQFLDPQMWISHSRTLPPSIPCTSAACGFFSFSMFGRVTENTGPMCSRVSKWAQPIILVSQSFSPPPCLLFSQLKEVKHMNTVISTFANHPGQQLLMNINNKMDLNKITCLKLCPVGPTYRLPRTSQRNNTFDPTSECKVVFASTCSLYTPSHHSLVT